MQRWKDNFISHANPDHAENYPFILVGNKIDLEDEWVVSTEKAEEWAWRSDIAGYFETSAKEVNTEGKHTANINDVFENVTTSIIEFRK